MDLVRIFTGSPENVELAINEFLESDTQPQIKDIKVNTANPDSKLIVLILYAVSDDEF